MSIARQELLDAQCARTVNRADEHDVAIASGDQLETAQQEGAHQNLAELAVRLNERQQRRPIELDTLARLGGADLHHDGTPCEYRSLTRAHAWSEGHDELFH